MSLNPIPFWYLRHGETDWNAEGRSQGNVDIPLNHVGILQAKRAAKTLHPVPIRTIVSSPLSRAKDTADMAAEVLKLPVLVDEDLREVNFGVQEGEPMGDWYDDWIADRFTPEGAETFAQLRARCVRAINRATALPGPVLVVAHGALWRAFRYEAGLPANVRTPNALPLQVKPDGQGSWSIEALELVPEF
ncbi:histidine phosphatase family protein [Roseococcus sp. SYP-B2431]|uniref:histidine phosphatase family protein n=1 Tax=Roseococcus sp. SYP-B2431 TaxID=2496640 RepID=UPI00103D6DAE|nr:histidine phosphatase family protein [Roseococcus sp. SYP-B2431]TCH99892.1 histidine phosphatase family protein [Roseococcus sp. SYP-B2431]